MKLNANQFICNEKFDLLFIMKREKKISATNLIIDYKQKQQQQNQTHSHANTEK